MNKRIELKFKNITKCTPNLYDKFLKFHSKKYKTRDMITVLFTLAIIIYMLVFNIVYHGYISAILIATIGILYLMSRNYYQKKVVKKELKSSKIKNEEEIEFYFYNRYFIVKKNGQRKKIRYFKLHRVNSDKENFYLYIDKTHAFILSKLGFIKGTPKKFERFISKKCIFRYST